MKHPFVHIKNVAGTDAYGDSALSYAKFGPEEVIRGKNEINYDGTDYNYSAE